MNDLIKKIVIDHVLAEPGIVAVIAAAVTNIDRLIAFALRFVPAATLKAELDRIDKLADAEVDKVAAQPQNAGPIPHA